MKDELKGHHALLKLDLFNDIIFTGLIQASQFCTLASTPIFTPTPVTCFDFQAWYSGIYDLQRDVHLLRPVHLFRLAFFPISCTTRQHPWALALLTSSMS